MDEILARYEAGLDRRYRDILGGLNSPVEIQAFLDSVRYEGVVENRCPTHVMRDNQSHCLDGGTFAAMALRRLGHPALLLDLLPDPGMDDDHVLALFQVDGHWGAVAKSNFVGLRYREPIFRTLRELVLSYFEHFFNIDGVKTLRYYTVPLDLATMDAQDWLGSDAGVDAIEKRLKTLRKFPLISPAMAARLAPMDPISYKADMLVVNLDGVFRPEKK